MRDRAVDDLLHTVNVARKRRHDHAFAFVGFKLCVQRFEHVAFGHTVPVPFHVGGVHHEEQNALVPDLRDTGKVGATSVDGRVVDLEIARQENDAPRRGDR